MTDQLFTSIEETIYIVDVEEFKWDVQSLERVWEIENNP